MYVCPENLSFKQTVGKQWAEGKIDRGEAGERFKWARRRPAEGSHIIAIRLGGHTFRGCVLHAYILKLNS